MQQQPKCRWCDRPPAIVAGVPCDECTGCAPIRAFVDAFARQAPEALARIVEARGPRIRRRPLGRGEEAAAAAIVEMKMVMQQQPDGHTLQARLQLAITETLVINIFREMDAGSKIMELLAVLPDALAPPAISAVNSLIPENAPDRSNFLRMTMTGFVDEFARAVAASLPHVEEPGKSVLGDKIPYPRSQV